MAEPEVKILYVEGATIRALHGHLKGDPNDHKPFLQVERGGRIIWVNKRFTVWIGPASWSDQEEGA
jgi:hypothetical protein